MKKDTPIAVIGFGSIGRRHYQNLLKLGYSNISVHDINPKQIKDFTDKRITQLNFDALKNFSVVFICTPAHKHVALALAAARAGCHLFIEKPLSHSLGKITDLMFLCRRNRLINMVACNMRFHPCLKFIQKYLGAGKLGRVYSINHEFGYYLPDWRPKQDYKKLYYGSRLMGGGIILDDIHEFDLLFWLNNFQKVRTSKFVFGKVSRLALNTEDICIASFRFANNVFGLVQSDYLQRHYSRGCKIVGELGTLTWDFNQNIVWLLEKGKKENLFKAANFQVNDMYMKQLKYFMDCVKRQENTENDIERAQQVLKICIER